MPGDYGVITLRGSRSESRHDLGKTKITRQTCCIHQDLSGSFPSQMSSLSPQLLLRAGVPLSRNLRGGTDRDESFHLAYQTFLGSSPCSSRLPAAPRMGMNGSAHPCHQILAPFFPRCTLEAGGNLEGAGFVNQPQSPSATLIQILPNPAQARSSAGCHLSRSWGVLCEAQRNQGLPCS